MKNNDEELKRALSDLYGVEQDDAFVERTLQRLPSRGAKWLWLILGNVAIWGCLLLLAVLYFPVIVRSMADVIADLSLKQMPDCDSLAVPMACVIVLFVAVIYCMELLDDYYRSMLRRSPDD